MENNNGFQFQNMEPYDHDNESVDSILRSHISIQVIH